MSPMVCGHKLFLFSLRRRELFPQFLRPAAFDTDERCIGCMDVLEMLGRVDALTGKVSRKAQRYGDNACDAYHESSGIRNLCCKVADDLGQRGKPRR